MNILGPLFYNKLKLKRLIKNLKRKLTFTSKNKMNCYHPNNVNIFLYVKTKRFVTKIDWKLKMRDIS